MNRLILLFAATLVTSSAFAELSALRVADDHRHLVTSDGRPFFLLGDTAWELFHRLTREEAEMYLKDRAAKGFNTILAVALAEYEFDKPNAYGEMPLENNDPAKPREPYFEHIGWIVDKAATLGLRIAMLPTWGDKWNQKWGKGPEIFTPENSAVFCEWLARRYKDKSVVWILGGDRPVENDRHREIIRAMAAGLKKGDGGSHLISYHPSGGRNSSDYWPDEPWLDFHMFQSGHARRATANYDMNARNLSLPVLKPTLDGEPNYEDHPVRSLMKDKNPTEWFDDYDTRRAAWWSVLSGACGHVYGTHSIWQFHDPKKRKPVTDAHTPWQQAMNLPGAAQMGVMKNFIEKFDWLRLRRNDAFIIPVMESRTGTRQIAAVSTDASFAIVYSPTRGAIRPDVSCLKLTHAGFDARGYDAATGKEIKLLDPTSGSCTFVPDTKSDWLLLIQRKEE